MPLKKLDLTPRKEPMNLAKKVLPHHHESRIPRFFFRPVFFVLAGLLVSALSIFIWTQYQPSRISIGDSENPGFLTQLGQLITSGDRKLIGESEDRVNILLMGIGGDGHDGAYLADTIMVISLRPSTKQISMLSIPRDLAVPILDYGYRKINNALAFGQAEGYEGGGEKLLSDVISEVFDIPIHYFARVDFQGFVDVIDRIGGVTIDVERSFTDYQYPTDDYGYQTIRFSAGTQRMDGATALEYVRSRHGNNGEGSDFARATRQQNVLQAAKNKILTFGTLLNPTKISGLLEAINKHYVSNIELWEMARIGNIAKTYDTDNIITYVLDNSAEGFLKTEIGLNGAYLLVPRAGDFEELQFLANNIFDIGGIKQEDALVMVQNGTTTPGLAGAASEEIASYGIETRLILERATDTGTTTLYDFTNGAAQETSAIIVEHFGATVKTGTQEMRDALLLSEQEAPDFLLIMGQDQVTPQHIS
ncbi:MAG: LCP family protein [Patescibacteria group bacterium]